MADAAALSYASIFAAHGRGEYSAVCDAVEAMRIDDPPTATQLRCIYLAADSLYHRGEYSEAARYLKFWRTRQAKHPDPTLAQLLPYVRFRAAQATQHLGEVATARQELESLHATPLDPPLQAAVALQLGWLAADHPEEQELALEYCRAAATAAAPGSRDAFSAGLLAGVLAADSGDDAAARDILTSLIAECGDADPHNVIAYKASLLLLRVVARQGGRLDDEGFCERLLNPPAGCEHLADAAKLQVGLYAAANGDAAIAVPLLTPTLELDSVSTQTRTAAALGLLRLPEDSATLPERIHWAEVLLSIDALPSDIRLEATVRLAELRFLQQQFGEALELYTRLVSADDAQIACLAKLRLGEVAALQNRWVDAARSVEELAELPSRFGHAAAIEYLHGRVLVAQGRFDEARERLRSAVSLAADARGTDEVAARAAWLIGETHFLQGRYDLALAAYEEVSRFDSQRQWCAAALLQGGKCCELTGDWASAASRYRELVESHPDSIYRLQADERLTQADTLAEPQLARQREEGATLR